MDPKRTATPSIICSECRSRYKDGKSSCSCANLHCFKSVVILGGLIVLYTVLIVNALLMLR